MKHDSARAVEIPHPSSVDEGTWLVKTASGVHAWTLDELDLAFQRGVIGAATPVFTAGMTEWQTLGVLADLDAPAANDTVATASPTPRLPEPSGPRSVAAAPARSLPPPPPRHLAPAPTSAVAPPARVARPLRSDARSFPPTTMAVFGNGASVWSNTAPPERELYTGVRRNAALMPFAVRRSFGSAFDFASNLIAHLRAVHPRSLAVGPWLFGAALSGVFIFALYQLANAPPGAGVHTRSGPALSYAAASATPSAREPAPASPATSNAATANVVSAEPGPSAAATRVAGADTLRAAGAVSNDTGSQSADEGSAVVRPGDLQFAPNRWERRALSSGRSKAKAKAASKRWKARAARKAQRSPRALAFGE